MILPTFPLTTWIAAGVAAAAFALLGVQTVRLAYEETAHAKTVTQHAKEMKGISDLALKEAQRTLAAERKGVEAVAAVEAKYTKEIRDGKEREKALRADVDSGKRRLRLNATCPATRGGDLPPAVGATSVADATAPELTPEARQDYFSLRDEIKLITAQVSGLQEYASACAATGK